MAKNAEVSTASTDLNLQSSAGTTSRRMLTFGGTAAAVAGLIAATPAAHADTALLADARAFVDTLTPTTPVAAAVADPGGDAEIVRLTDAIMDGYWKSRRLDDEEDTTKSRSRNAEIAKQKRVFTEHGWAMRQQLVTMPATTLAGFRAKARVVHEFNNCFDGYADGFEDDALAWSLASDLLGRKCVLKEGAEDETWAPLEVSVVAQPFPVLKRDAADLSAHLAQSEADYAFLGVCEKLQHEDAEVVEQGWLDAPDEYAAFETQLVAVHARYEAVAAALRGQRIKFGVARLVAFSPSISDDDEL